MTERKKYKVVIIEPSPVIQQGIKTVLETNSEFEILSIHTDFDSFQHVPKGNFIDVLLVNPSIISFYKQFAVKSWFSEYQNTAIVAVLYTYADKETLNSFDGVLDIYDESSLMIKKLKKIIEITSNKEETNNTTSDNVDLSDREKEILISVTKGLTNKEVAEKHFISIHTVISHRKNITRKTGIKTVSGLTMYALFNNLISQEEI